VKNYLFIIGNGFDVAHGISSKFSNFGEYLEKNDTKVFEAIQKYLFVDKNFWNCFEERLATLDYDSIIDYATDFLVGYGDENWSDAYHHDFEYEIQQITSNLSDRLKLNFHNWIDSLEMPTAGNFDPVRCIDPSSQFLSFNYTSTLQDLYKVPDENVIHIHGSLHALDEELIIGHGWLRQHDEKLSPKVNEDTDVRVGGGYKLIDDYFADTFKPTDDIIEECQGFFSGLNEVTDVIVLGHSISEVDMPYFREIVKHFDVDKVRWLVSFYGSPDSLRNSFSCLGVNSKLICFRSFDEF